MIFKYNNNRLEYSDFSHKQIKSDLEFYVYGQVSARFIEQGSFLHLEGIDLISKLFVEKGLNFVHFVKGAFFIVIREKGIFHCFTDHLGIVDVKYAGSHAGFIFTTEDVDRSIRDGLEMKKTRRAAYYLITEKEVQSSVYWSFNQLILLAKNDIPFSVFQPFVFKLLNNYGISISSSQELERYLLKVGQKETFDMLADDLDLFFSLLSESDKKMSVKDGGLYEYYDARLDAFLSKYNSEIKRFKNYEVLQLFVDLDFYYLMLGSRYILENSFNIFRKLCV